MCVSAIAAVAMQDLCWVRVVDVPCHTRTAAGGTLDSCVRRVGFVPREGHGCVEGFPNTR